MKKKCDKCSKKLAYIIIQHKLQMASALCEEHFILEAQRLIKKLKHEN